MTTWFLEPGHTAAMFRARHMMVTYVRGHFKNVSGSLVFDPENPARSSADVTIDAGTIWTGQPQRDAHLRSVDFLDVEHHPRITFTGNQVDIAGARDYTLRGALMIRGVSREVKLKVNYLGQWRTPWWEEQDGKWIDKGPRVRAGFVAKTRINRHDFGVSWNDRVDKGGVVVGDTIDVTIDAEAILEERTKVRARRLLLASCGFPAATATALSHDDVKVNPFIPIVLLWIGACIRDRSIFVGEPLHASWD